jgi:hypothetical protein
MRKIIGALILVLFGASAMAKDQVSIRYRPGYPPPEQASESAELIVSRSGSTVGEPTEVDRYFTEIRRILKEAKIPLQWGYVTIDGDSIQVNISLDKQAYVLSFSYVGNDIALPPNPSAAEKRIATAIKAVVKLTSDRANADFGIK